MLRHIFLAYFCMFATKLRFYNIRNIVFQKHIHNSFVFYHSMHIGSFLQKLLHTPNLMKSNKYLIHLLPSKNYCKIVFNILNMKWVEY
jgi:hypothetical protein